jgi:hypothetical protein
MLKITSDSENNLDDDEHDELSDDEYAKTRDELKRLGYI